jgi:hypothetical protein
MKKSHFDIKWDSSNSESEYGQNAQLQGLVPYKQHLILFVTYECAPKARALDYARSERFDSDKHLAYWVHS